MNRPDTIVLKSIHKNLTDMFESGEIMSTPYTVGNEGDMRAGTRLAFPYVYILPFGRLFQVEHLPVVIVQVTIYSVVTEMGNGGDAIDVQVDLHIFGRDAIQKTNIKGALRTQLESWKLYDFDDPNTTVLDECDIIEDSDGHTWMESNHSINSEKLAIEASLADWTTMSCSFQALGLGG